MKCRFIVMSCRLLVIYCLFSLKCYAFFFVIQRPVFFYIMSFSLLWNSVSWLWKLMSFSLLCNVIFSSPELKAQVGFFSSSLARLLSIRPSVNLSVCLSVWKPFTFSSSSSERLDQFQPNLAQSIPGWGECKFVQMKGHT